jgi:hypothetical protein
MNLCPLILWNGWPAVEAMAATDLLGNTAMLEEARQSNMSTAPSGAVGGRVQCWAGGISKMTKKMDPTPLDHTPTEKVQPTEKFQPKPIDPVPNSDSRKMEPTPE